MPLLSKPGLIPVKIENQSSQITTQVNKINFTGSGVTASVDQFNDITVLINGGGGGASGVTQIIAGTNISISPAGGTGVVTINSTTPVSASYAFYATSASYALTSSYADTASLSVTSQNILVYCKNQSGYTITKGMVVRITGSNNSSDIPRIVSASYENDNNSANTLGIANESILNGSEGYVITEGILKGINTTAYTSGQLLYLGATGSITGSVPQAPLHAVRLGEVIREQTNNGSIYVRIDNGYELDELHDVRIISASTGDILIRSSSVWINSKSLTGSYSITGSLIISGSSAFTNIGSATFSGSVTGISGFTGSFSGSFIGALTGTASWASNAISSSYALTSSYASNTLSASYAPDTTFPYTGSARITGSLILTGSLVVSGSTLTTASALLVYKSGSTVVDIQGSSGQLFSITDSLTGSLFSVNTVAGLPVIEAFSDNTVNIGKYGLYPIKVVATGSSAVITGSFTGSFSGSFFGTSSWSTSSSMATSASYAFNATSASWSVSSSRAVSSSYAVSASWAPSSPSVSASYAATSSYPWADNGAYISYTNGKVQIGREYDGTLYNPYIRLQVASPQLFTYPTLGSQDTGSFFLSGDIHNYGIYMGVHCDLGNGWLQVMRNDAPQAYNMMIQPVGGNVGIGTTSITARVNIRSAGTTNSTYALVVENSTPSDIFHIKDDGEIYSSNLSTTGPVVSTGGVLSSITGYNGTITFPTNPPGQQNLVFTNGILTNVF